jgi:hypothetical protein
MKVIPSFDFAPEPGLLALDFIELTVKPVDSAANSIVSNVSLLPFL